MNGEKLRLKEDKEGETTTYSGKVFQCDTMLGKKNTSKSQCVQIVGAMSKI